MTLFAASTSYLPFNTKLDPFSESQLPHRLDLILPKCGSGGSLPAVKPQIVLGSVFTTHILAVFHLSFHKPGL